MASKLWTAIFSIFALACNANAFTINAGSWIWTVPSSGGTANYVMTTAGSSGITTWSQVALGSAVTGLLPFANGGCNKNLTPVAGGVLWTDGDSCEVSAAGSSGQILKSNGTSAPSWVDSVGASGVTGSVQFASGGAFASDGANLFWDDTNDRIGIGTAAPAQKLDVLESSGWAAHIKSGSVEAYIAHSGGQGLYVDSAGQASPSEAAFTVLGTGQPFQIMGDGRISATSSVLHEIGATSIYGNSLNGAPETDGDAALLLNYAGYAAGLTQFRDLRVMDGKGADVMFVDGSTARVGIGTITPNEQLELTGNLRLSTASIVYLDGFSFLHGGGSTGNFFGGYSATYSNASVASSVGIGQNTKSCSRCVVAGASAGTGLSGASNLYHTLIGFGAGTNLETGGVSVSGGSDSIAIGAASGFDSATPANSISIGDSAIGRSTNAVTLGNYGHTDFNLGSDLFSSSSSTARTIRVGNAFGTDKNAGALTLQGSRSTGTGTGGDIVVKVAPAAASTSSSLNTPAEVMRFNAGTSPGTPYVTITDAGANGGNVLHAFTRRTNTSTSSATCSVDCSAGEKAMGGGCNNTVALAMQKNYPTDDDTWSCEYALATGDCTAYAMCAQY